MKLLLVRHGETDWNAKSWIQGRTDISLNEKGERQAEELGDQLLEKGIHVARIYTSKLKRAKQTASIVSRMLDVPYAVEEGLEEMHLGVWEGKTWRFVRDEYADAYRAWGNRRYIRTPEGESYQDLLDRLMPALKRILDRKQGDALIVTHSACIMTLLSYLRGTPFEDMVANYRIGNAQICTLDEADIHSAYAEDYR